MPYYCGPRFQFITPTESNNADTLHIQSLLMDITIYTGWGHTHLSNIPIHVGKLAPVVHTATSSQTLLNSELVLYARLAMQYDWPCIHFQMDIFLL